MEDGDSCCDDAKEKLAQSWSDKNNFSPSQYQKLRSQLDSMDCGDFRNMMETIPNAGPETDMANHESNINRDQNILDEWDECASRTSMGMKYASADPFEAGWNHVEKANEGGRPMDNSLAVRQRINDILLPDEDTIPDVANLQTDMGNDPCCGEARELWRDGLIEGWGDSTYTNDPEGGQAILEYYDAMSCEEFRQSLESRFDAQGYAALHGRRSLTRGGMNPNSPRSNHSWEDSLANRVMEAWDKCAEARIPATPEGDMGDEDMGFYASADPFETAWDIVQKQIGREDFGYSMAVQPHMMSNKFGNMPPELGLRTSGSLPIKEAIQHLENSQSIEDFARTKGWESAEDVGLKLEDFDDEWEFYERAAEMGVGYPPEDHLDNEYMYFRPHHAQQMAARGRGGGLSDAEILRNNMQGMGHPNEWREAFPPVAREAMLGALDTRLEAGATRAPVSTGSISAMGQGPMIDVNPAFAGMGLGYSTLASLLENTGRLQENYMSAGGLATLQGLGRKLDEAGIGHKLGISPTVGRPVMNAQQQLNNWQDSNARYPHQGSAEMSIDDGAQLTHQGTPDKLAYITHSINQQLDNERPSTVEELKAMLEASKRERRMMGNMPPSMNRFPPFSAPSWQDRIAWGE